MRTFATLVLHEQNGANLLKLVRIHHHVRHNLEHRPTLNALSAIADYSPAHLIRAFRRVFGETPSEFSGRLREQDAWRLVTSTDLAIQEIASQLGYGNQSAFCRVFKTLFGMTASQARLMDLDTQGRCWRRVSSPTGIGP